MYEYLGGESLRRRDKTRGGPRRSALTGGIFQVLGVPPHAGTRSAGPFDDYLQPIRASWSSVNRLWSHTTNRFGSEPRPWSGKMIRINQRGIPGDRCHCPPGFAFPSTFQQLWLPIQLTRDEPATAGSQFLHGRGETQGRRDHRRQARSEFARQSATRLAAEYPPEQRGPDPPNVIPMRKLWMAGRREHAEDPADRSRAGASHGARRT